MRTQGGLVMEIRQILMVATFMFAAAIMKSAMPGQMPAEALSSRAIDEGSDQVLSPKIITALAPAADLLLINEDKPPKAGSSSSLQKIGFESAPIPGSLIALVVAAMGLVSVARRPV